MADKVDAVIKVKRGPEAQRKIVTFGDGELAYSNDVKRLFVGDGGIGGNPASTRVHITSSTPAYALSGDLMVKVNNDIRRLYALTGADYTNLNAYTLLANSDVDACVQSNSALWNAGGLGGNAGPGTEAWTVVSVQSAYWNSTYTTVNQASATWSSGGGGSGSLEQFIINTIVQEHSASWDEVYNTVVANSASWENAFSSAVLSTFNTPLTANGKFLVVDIEGTPQAIRLWDTP
jgi:hypothetical protein